MNSRLLHNAKLFLALLLTGALTLQISFAQSTQGTDFWFTYMTNNSTPESTDLILSAQRACTATISNPNTGWTTTVSIGANARADVVVPMASGYITNNETIEFKACHIVATDTISAYSMNYKNASFDGGNLLPTNTLMDEYMIQTWTTDLDGSEFVIIATENNTVIDITPSALTSGGHAAGVTYSITMNQGQTYQCKTSSESATFTGTHIKARDCKKIAVFAGHECARVPYDCTYCDHIYEPMLPVAYWGTHFIPTLSYGRTKDKVRVTALNNNTTVSKNGTLVATLQAGGFYDFEMNSSAQSCFIETSGPAVCYLYLVGQSCGGTDGDPSMVLINPVEQHIKQITFGTYQPSGYTYNHYVNIVTPSVNVPSVTLDGTSISSSFSAVTGNSQYSYARIPVSHAGHTLRCDSGLVAHVYGLAPVTSYAYAVGASVRPINAPQMFVNEVNVADIPENQQYCANRDIDFELQVDGDFGDIIWDFGDGTSEVGNPVSHLYPSDGQYRVTAYISGITIGCLSSLGDTLFTIVNIPPPDPIPVYESICEGNTYDFYGRILTESGVYLDTLTTGSECDTVIELHLSFIPQDPIPIYDTICPGESYFMNGNFYSQPGIYYDTLATSGGCDSILELHLIVSPVPSVNLGSDKVLCGMEEFPVLLSPSVATTGTNPQYMWSTGETSHSINAHQPGLFSVTVTNQAGCVGSSSVEIRLQDAISISVEQTSDFCDDGITTLIATTNAPNIRWNTGETTAEIEIHAYGRYSVKAYDGACEADTAIDILRCPFDLYFPNCITASFDDGMNDQFHMYGVELVSEFEIWIYDRWGMLVFHSTDPHFHWDGIINGKVAANQVFSWRAFATPKTEKKKYALNGTIIVL